MTGSVELVIGQQASAALTVADAIPTFHQVLTGLGDEVETAAVGFTGDAAAGLAEALGAWFEVAVGLAPVLEKYAAALVTVDSEHSVNEERQVTTYSTLSSRLGGQ